MVKNLRLLGFVFLSSASLISCTRDLGSDAKVTLDMGSYASQKVGSQSVSVVRRIMVNISAADMPTAVWIWNSPCDDSACAVQPPSEIVMEVKPGSARLVQVLILTKDDTSEEESFHYGETLSSLNSGANEVSVSTSVVGSGSSSEANISGQYVSSVVGGKGHGLTGKIEVLFKPTATANPIVVDSAEMFDGWFSLFGMEGIPFAYRMAGTGELLQYNGQNLSFDHLKADLATNSATRPYVSMYKSPDVFWVQDGGGGSRRKQHGGYAVLGFFGPAYASLSSPTVCYNDYMSTSNFWDDEVSGSNLTFNNTLGESEDIQYYGGGLRDYSPNMATCQVPTNEYKNLLLLKMEGIRNGKSGTAGFQGPFANKFFSSECGGGYTGNAIGCYNTSTNQYFYYWNYIPGVFSQSDSITGVALFQKVNATHCDENCEQQFRMSGSDGYRCGQLESLGFTKMADADSTMTNYGGTMVLPNNSELIAILCPFREAGGSRQYFNSGLRIHGQLQGPYPSISGLNVGTINDTTVDPFLVDSTISSRDIYYSWNTVAGADTYEARIYESGNPIGSCDINSNGATGAMLTSSAGCGGAMYGYADGQQFEYRLVAKDVNGNIIAQGFYPFKMVKNLPQINSASVTSCGTSWGGGPYVQMDFNMNVNSSTTQVEVNVFWGSTNATVFNVSPGPNGGNFPIGLLQSTASQTINITLRARHSSGYISDPYVGLTSTNYTWNGSVGSCAP